jgi:ribonuclease BN (tRNA processing enzyme)
MCLFVGASCLTAPAPAQIAAATAKIRASQPSADHYEWVTLGTQGGPMPSASRGEPANLLAKKDGTVLVDVGDGAATRMIVAGAPMPTLRAIFLSHLHVDHIGGLFGVIGLRNQMHVTTPLAIYGPPGTKALVSGIVAALTPSAEAGYGIDGEKELRPDNALTVFEVTDGSTVNLPDMTVRVAKNTHYTFGPDEPRGQRFASLSFRFNLPDRSIAYTGDTGPSTAVEELARAADLLVTEMIDPEWTKMALERRSVGTDSETLAIMREHLTKHHLSPQQVAELAARSGVKRVVITHLAGGGADDPGSEGRYVRQINQIFQGPVIVARDFDRF